MTGINRNNKIVEMLSVYQGKAVWKDARHEKSVHNFSLYFKSNYNGERKHDVYFFRYECVTVDRGWDFVFTGLLQSSAELIWLCSRTPFGRKRQQLI